MFSNGQDSGFNNGHHTENLENIEVDSKPEDGPPISLIEESLVIEEE